MSRQRQAPLNPWTELANELYAIRQRTVNAQRLAADLANYGDGIRPAIRRLLARRMTDAMVTACKALIEWEQIASNEANRHIRSRVER